LIKIAVFYQSHSELLSKSDRLVFIVQCSGTVYFRITLYVQIPGVYVLFSKFRCASNMCARACIIKLLHDITYRSIL